MRVRVGQCGAVRRALMSVCTAACKIETKIVSGAIGVPRGVLTFEKGRLHFKVLVRRVILLALPFLPLCLLLLFSSRNPSMIKCEEACGDNLCPA